MQECSGRNLSRRLFGWFRGVLRFFDPPMQFLNQLDCRAVAIGVVVSETLMVHSAVRHTMDGLGLIVARHITRSRDDRRRLRPYVHRSFALLDERHLLIE